MASVGSSGGRIAVPNTSMPCHPTVHSPNENLSAGVGVYASIAAVDSRAQRAAMTATSTRHAGRASAGTVTRVEATR